MVKELQELLGDEYCVTSEGANIAISKGSVKIRADNVPRNCDVRCLAEDVAEIIHNCDRYAEEVMQQQNYQYSLVNRERYSNEFQQCRKDVVGDIVAVVTVNLGSVRENYSARGVVGQDSVAKVCDVTEEFWEGIRKRTIERYPTVWAVLDIENFAVLPEGVLPFQPMPVGGIELPKCGMVVITNTAQLNGAINAFDTELLDVLAVRNQCDVVVLPSSIHEGIVMRMLEGDELDSVYSLTELVREANKTVPPKEILSQFAYVYRKDKKELEVINEDFRDRS